MGFLHPSFTTLHSTLDLLNLPCTPSDLLNHPRAFYMPCILLRSTIFPRLLNSSSLLHPPRICCIFAGPTAPSWDLHLHCTPCISLGLLYSPYNPWTCYFSPLDLLYFLHPPWACCISHSISLPATCPVHSHYIPLHPLESATPSAIFLCLLYPLFHPPPLHSL